MNTELIGYKHLINNIEKLNYEESEGLACSIRHNNKLCPCGANFNILLENDLTYPVCEDCLNIIFNTTKQNILSTL